MRRSIRSVLGVSAIVGFAALWYHARSSRWRREHLDDVVRRGV